MTTLRAVSLDFWDTLYVGEVLAARVEARRRAMGRLLEAHGRALPADELVTLYGRSAAEADRWWAEEHRGYTTEERIRWLLAEAGVRPPAGCPHVAAAVAEVDDVLLRHPPPLLPGAAALVRALAARVPLVIVSDTGFASGAAQDRLLERDELRDCFVATIYSMDVGHAKPRREPFDAAARALGVAPAAILHVGDNERTDVRGALAAGFRAVRLDVVRQGGASAAELVATSFDALAAHVERAIGGGERRAS